MARVVIGADGDVKCEGRDRAETLGDRAGWYAVHPGSSGVVLLERIDGVEATATTREHVVAYGEVTGPTTVAEALQSATASGWRGTFTVASGASRRQLGLNRGILTSARSNVPSERLGELMVHNGMITRAELDHCLSQAGARRIGEAVVLEGLIDPEELFAALQDQARCIFDGAVLTAHGHYLCSLPPADAEAPAMTVHLQVQGLLMESMQRIDEAALLRGRAPVEAEGAEDEPVRQLMARLNAILRHIVRTVGEHGTSDQMAWTFLEWVRDTTLGKYFHVVSPEGDEICIDLAPDSLHALQDQDPIAVLRGAGIELVSFALFAASPSLAPDQERQLKEWVNERVLRLAR